MTRILEIFEYGSNLNPVVGAEEFDFFRSSLSGSDSDSSVLSSELTVPNLFLVSCL